jgi:hypothetical protein
MNWTKIDKNNK